MHQDVNDGYHRESRVTDNFMYVGFFKQGKI